MKVEKKEVGKIRIRHNRKLFWVIILLMILLAVLIYFIIQNSENGDENGGVIERECETDSDCVASSCCHPDSCVSIENAPNCDRAICTEVCLGPLDCGAGYCGCINNKCEVVSNEN